MSHKVLNKSSLFFGIGCAACYLISRRICGDGLDMVHMISSLNIFPPIWIFNLLYAIFYFLIGISAGSMACDISDKRIFGDCEISAYRGGIFFTCAFFLGMIWFPVFFISQSLFFSLLIIILALMSALICMLQWFKTPNMLSPSIMAAFSAWIFYILFLNLSVLLRF